MNVKTTIVLLALVLALIVVILLLEEDETGPPEFRPLLDGVFAEEVMELTWSVGGEETTVRRVEEFEDDWVVVVSGLAVPADSTEIEDVLNDVTNTRIRTRIAADEVDAGARVEYGLDPAVAWVKVSSADAVKKVHIGEKGLRRDTVYARLDDEEDVLLVDDDVFSAIEGIRAKDVRARRILDGSVYDVTAAAVADPEGLRIAAKRSEKDSTIWVATEPFAGYLDPQEMESNLLPAVLSLEAEEFVADGVADEELEKYGLAAPRYRVSLSMKDEEAPRTLLVGSELPEKEGWIHFMEEGKPFVYGGKGGDLLQHLEKDPADYRDRNLTRLGWMALGGFEGQLGEVAFAAVLEEDEWRLTKPEKMELEDIDVKSWLQHVRELEIVEFLDGPDLDALGLTEPRGELAFFGPEESEHDHGADPDKKEDDEKEGEEEEADPIVSIVIGAAVEGGENVYAMRKGEEETAFVVGPGLLDLLESGHYRMKKRAIFAVDQGILDIVGIERSVTGSEPEKVEMTEGKWPEDTSPPLLNRVVTKLLDLQAARWVGKGEGREEEYGLGETPAGMRIVVAMRKRSGEEDADREYGVVVGGETEGGRYSRAIREGKPDPDVFVISPASLEGLKAEYRKKAPEEEDEPPDEEKPGEEEKPDEEEKPGEEKRPDEEKKEGE